MRFLKLRWVKVTGLFSLGLLPAVFIYIHLGFSDAKLAEQLRYDGRSHVILYKETIKWGGYNEGLYPYNVWTLGKDVYVQFNDLNIDSKLIVPYSELSEWKVGRPVTITYSEANGVRLVDDQTGRYASVIYISNHPIECYHDQLIESMTGTEVAESQINIETTRRWKVEIERIYQAVLDKKYMKGEDLENFIKLQKLRNEFIQQQSAVYVKGLYHSPGGSVKRFFCSVYILSVMRNAARDMMNVADWINEYNVPNVGELEEIKSKKAEMEKRLALSM
jgi:hypothetical protein